MANKNLSKTTLIYIKLQSGGSFMYDDGQVLGASTTLGASVTSLPLTSGNSAFQAILIAIAIVAFAVLAVRITKLVIAKRAK